MSFSHSTRNNSTIDNIFTNIKEYRIEQIQGNISDHEPQVMKFPLNNKTTPKTMISARRFPTAEKQNLLNALTNEDWKEVLAEEEPNSMFSLFLDTVLFHYNSQIPYRTCSTKKNMPTNHPLELANIKETLNLIKDTLMMNPLDEELQEIFRSYKAFYTQQCEEYHKFSNNVQLSKASNKPKAIWKKINEITGRCKTFQSQDKPTSEDFSDHFAASIASLHDAIPKQDNQSNYRPLNIASGKTFFFNPTDKQEVSTTIKRLKRKRTKDHYDLDTETLQYIEPAISEVLATIINRCISTGVFPEKLKTGKITPVFKKGSSADASNYRPISVLPPFSKVFETIIANRITDFFEQQDYFCDNQFGFRAGRGTEDAIVHLMTLITSALEDGEQCNALFFDLTKAFDCMCHETFLKKMEHYGFRGISLDLLRSYLSNRHQYVFHNGKRSSVRRVNCGVPQGSIVGALFFIIYINELPKSITAAVTQYVDDTTTVLRGHEPQITISSENAKKEAAEWFAHNHLALNINKTAELFITSSRRDQREVKDVKFLGVHLDTRLTWLPQVEKLLPVLASVTYAVKRIRTTIGISAARTTYFALFHSRMSYGLKLWGGSAHTYKVLLS